MANDTTFALETMTTSHPSAFKPPAVYWDGSVGPGNRSGRHDRTKVFKNIRIWLLVLVSASVPRQ